MNENGDLTIDKDILGQELPLVYIKFEEISGKKEKIDYSQIYVLPTIKSRYFSTLIDVVVILLLSLGISSLFDAIGLVPDYVRGIFFVVVIVLYEPILVTFGATVGQLLLGIRVRNFKNPEKKIVSPLILLRFIIKLFLGWLSFITVTFNINRRAIHDFASGSIMIANKIEKNSK